MLIPTKPPSVFGIVAPLASGMMSSPFRGPRLLILVIVVDVVFVKLAARCSQSNGRLSPESAGMPSRIYD